MIQNSPGIVFQGDNQKAISFGHPTQPIITRIRWHGATRLACPFLWRKYNRLKQVGNHELSSDDHRQRQAEK